MNQPTFLLGAVVRHKSGGPRMTVGRIVTRDEVYCQWFVKSSLYSGYFNPNELVVVR